MPAASIPTTVSAGIIMYSIASSTGAAAGNRYEEVVYALPGSNPCLAVRTYIHYGVLENYATGTVKAFDRAALEKSFVAIRDSVTFVPHVVPIAPIVPVSTSTKTATTSTAPISVQ